MTEPAPTIYACVDRTLPPEMQFKAAAVALKENPANAPVRRPPVADRQHTPFAMALETRKLWKPGRKLRVRFLDGPVSLQLRVAQIAAEWTQHANLQFAFGNDPEAEIRISFSAGPGSWSYIGTDSLLIEKGEPTMNYGWLTPQSTDEECQRVVLHEFGHALGCIHEHQHPEVGIPWNKPAVYEYYSKPPNSWTPDKVDRNLFQSYNKDLTQFSAFDRDSIMLYPVPKELTLGGFEVGWNTRLSTTDKSFISTIYPFNQRETLALTIGSDPLKAEIGAYGEEDWYSFQVEQTGTYCIETGGRADVQMGLYGPEQDTQLIADDDNSGRLLNARIAIDLAPGRYFVRVRHHRPKGKGKYTLWVKQTA